MKSALVLAAFSLVIAAASGAAHGSDGHSVQQHLAASIKKCTTEHHTPDEKVKASADESHIPQDETERCFLECVYKEMGLLSDTGFNHDAAMKLADARFKNTDEHTKAVRLVNTCASEIKPSSEKCWGGLAVRKCFATNGKKDNLKFFSVEL